MSLGPARSGEGSSAFLDQPVSFVAGLVNPRAHIGISSRQRHVRALWYAGSIGVSLSASARTVVAGQA
jgi:hypothetical protein